MLLTQWFGSGHSVTSCTGEKLKRGWGGCGNIFFCRWDVGQVLSGLLGCGCCLLLWWW
jgi:hypothetical protein